MDVQASGAAKIEDLRNHQCTSNAHIGSLRQKRPRTHQPPGNKALSVGLGFHSFRCRAIGEGQKQPKHRGPPWKSKLTPTAWPICSAPISLPREILRRRVEASADQQLRCADSGTLLIACKRTSRTLKRHDLKRPMSDLQRVRCGARVTSEPDCEHALEGVVLRVLGELPGIGEAERGALADG